MRGSEGSRFGIRICLEEDFLLFILGFAETLALFVYFLDLFAIKKRCTSPSKGKTSMFFFANIKGMRLNEVKLIFFPKMTGSCEQNVIQPDRIFG